MDWPKPLPVALLFLGTERVDMKKDREVLAFDKEELFNQTAGAGGCY